MLINADARHIPLRDGSVQMVCTSPPFWGLRDYGTARWDGGDPDCDHTGVKRSQEQGTSSGRNAGSPRDPIADACVHCGAVRVDAQIGLEATPEAYVANIVAVMREVWRVLRDDGTLWLNLGDSYAGGGNYRGVDSESTLTSKQRSNRGARGLSKALGAAGKDWQGCKPKDLVGIPWRVAFALQAEGWYLRSDIIWSKPNPMPESIMDRPTKSHEYLFLLAKSPRYFYDADAIAEPASSAMIEQMKTAYNGVGVKDYESAGVQNPSDVKRRIIAGKSGNLRRHMAEERGNISGGVAGNVPWEGITRNRRSVWTIPTQTYAEAHFATYPEKLVEPCIKAGTSAKGCCPICRTPWERVREKGEVVSTGGSATGARASNLDTVSPAGQTADDAYNTGAFTQYAWRTLGWEPGCECNPEDVPAEPVPCLVFDPFSGSGTTGRVALRLGRRYVGLDLNANYIGLAQKRTSDVQMELLEGL